MGVRMIIAPYQKSLPWGLECTNMTYCGPVGAPGFGFTVVSWSRYLVYRVSKRNTYSGKVQVFLEEGELLPGMDGF